MSQEPTPFGEKYCAEAKVERLEKVVKRLKVLTHKYRQAEVMQQALFRISELASSAQSLEHLYVSIHKIVNQLMAAKNFYICLYNDNRTTFTFPYFCDQYDTIEIVKEVPVETLLRGLTGYILRTGSPLLATKKDIDALNESGKIVTVGARPVDWLGVPLIHENEVIGAMVVQSYAQEVRYTQEDLELLTFVSQHVVNALERVRHHEWMKAEIEHQTAELRFANEHLLKEVTEREKAEKQTNVLYAISELTNTSEDMHSFYRALHEQINLLINAENFYIALLTENKQQIYFPYYVDESGYQGKKRRLRKGLTEYVLRKGQPTFINGALKDKLLAAGEVEANAHNGRFAYEWLGVPLVIDNEVFGILSVQVYGDEQVYHEDDLEVLNFVSQHVAVAIERRRAAERLSRANAFLEKRIAERTEELVEEIERRKTIEAQLFHDAHHDTLTGLPNRAMFTERVKQVLLAQKRRSKEFFAVLFVDLDRFKVINDTLGHAAGDRFLLEVSHRLSTTIREHDLLARLGGDEFVILLDRITTIDDAKDVAARIVDIMAKPFQLHEQTLFSGASIGITTWRDEQDSVGRLLRDADAAMYEAKSLGRSRYVVFDETIRSGLVEAISQEAALRHAKVNKDFVLWYQPIFNLNNDNLLGYELLLRWQKGHELVAPNEFLELAERSGSIINIDIWMLQQACSIIQAQESEQPIAIHLNLSTQHLLRMRHVQKIIEVVEAVGVSKSALVLEFDENSLLSESQKRILASLRRLKDAGFKLALDDFGRVSGPLQLLYNFPFDLIKLDHRFIALITRSARAQSLVQHVVTLCDALKIRLSAEGIETSAQKAQLTSLGVQYGQGKYLFPPGELPTNREIIQLVVTN